MKPGACGALGLLWAALLAVSGPAGAQSPRASPANAPSAEPSSVAVGFAAAAAAELDLVAELRGQAGFSALLGPDGEAILASLDGARREHAETALPAFVDALQAAEPEGLALIGPAASRPLTTADQEAGGSWSGSVLGQASATTSMVLSLAGLLIAGADEDGGGSLTRSDTYERSAGAGVRERIEIATTYRMTRGAGRLTFAVEIRSTDVLRDAASGAETARLTGIGLGSIDVSACPDPRGVGEGRAQLAWSETLTPAGGRPGAATSATTDAPFAIWVTDAARWSRIDVTMDLRRAAAGPGTPGGDPSAPFDWSAQASVPLTITAPGGTVRGTSPTTVSGRGAPADQATRTVGGHIGMGHFLTEIAKEAERFWRSGRCIELTTTPASGRVAAGATLEIEARAVHRFDGQPVEAPIVAAFSGTQAVEPVGTPIAPPGPFRYTAGARPGDSGTIELTQTGRRGIGRVTVRLAVERILAGDACGKRNCYAVAQACDRPDLWLIDVSGQVVEAYLTATITPPEGEARMVLETPVAIVGRTWARWLRGTATLVAGDRATFTIANKDGRVRVPLSPSDHCARG